MAARKHPTTKGREADRSTTPSFDVASPSTDEIVQRAIRNLRLDIAELTKKEHVSN